jgi:integrase
MAAPSSAPPPVPADHRTVEARDCVRENEQAAAPTADNAEGSAPTPLPTVGDPCTNSASESLSPDQPSDSPAAPTPRLLDRVRIAIRLRHYAIRTEDAYVDWVRRYIVFHDKRHPQALGAKDVEAFLSYLASERYVAPSTQNQAKSALLFLYKEVLQLQLPWLDEIVGAKERHRLPVVLTPSEVRALLNELGGTMWLVASLLYGTGMRLLEGLRLRVKDIDFERRELLVRDGKGAKDRVTVLPENLVLPLRSAAVARPVAPRRRPARRLRRRLAAERPRAQVPRRLAELGLAVGLPRRVAHRGPALGHRAPPPPPRSLRAEGGGHGRAARRHRQALLAARAAPFLRHAHAASRL